MDLEKILNELKNDNKKSNLGEVLRKIKEEQSQEPDKPKRDRMNIFRFVEQEYQDKSRKGLAKLDMSHPADTLEEMHIEEVRDLHRSVNMFKGGLLHDILEDFEVTEDELQSELDLNEETMDILRKLTRGSMDRESYWDNIAQNKDAFRVKLADRVANLKDLRNWVKSRKGFTVDSKLIFDKYKAENEVIEEKFEDTFKQESAADYIKSREVASMWKQKMKIKELLKDIDNLEEKYGSNNLKESTLNEKLYDAERFDIEKDDIYETIEIIKDMYHNYPELQDAYPTFLDRLDNSINELENIIDNKGFDYLKSIFDKVKFDIDDFTEAYKDWVKQKIANVIPKLESLREPIPKDGLITEIANKLGTTEDEVEERIKQEDKEQLKEIYNVIIDLMEDSFEDIADDVTQHAKMNDGEAIWRPGKYKKQDRAIEKFFDKKEKGKYEDFLELGDILGFRGRFDDVADMAQFAVDMIEEKEQFLYKVNNYLGKGEAYQGVNMSFNHDGDFNYEVQSVVDKMQVATDVNHDILYKEVIEVSDQESKAIMMLVQICLGLMFEDIFTFDTSVEVD